MNDEAGPKPPYVAYTSFRNFINGVSKDGIIPSRIDKTLMSGHSGSTQSYLMAALRFFGLIDSTGAPTPDFQSLVNAEGDERKATWQGLFTKAYAPILGDVDLSRATLGMLNDVFGQQGLTGDTLRKCESFLAAAAEDAGIVLAPQLKPNARASSGGARKSRKKGNGTKILLSPKADEFSGDHGGGSTGEAEASQLATLLLDGAGKRSVKVKAPAMITKAELERIQKWLSFQLIVEDE